MTKKPYVLIVEDDEWLAQQFMRTLQGSGMETGRAPHALAAIDMIDERLPDGIVLDVLLPGANAFTLLHELRSHADLAAIPVILCTNNADRLCEEDVAAYGVQRILDKTTMHPDELAAAIKRVLL